VLILRRRPRCPRHPRAPVSGCVGERKSPRVTQWGEDASMIEFRGYFSEAHADRNQWETGPERNQSVRVLSTSGSR
jgi:hypothetical protein